MSNPVSGAAVLIASNVDHRRQGILAAAAAANAVVQSSADAATAVGMLEAVRFDIVIAQFVPREAGTSLLRRAAELRVPALELIEPPARDDAGPAVETIRVLPRRLAPVAVIEAAAAWLSERRSARGRRTSVGTLPDLDGMRVLMVGADADVQQMMTGLLRACRASVHSAPSAEAAVRAIKTSRPDVVLFEASTPDPTSSIAVTARSARVPAIVLDVFGGAGARIEMLARHFGVRVLSTTDVRAVVDLLQDSRAA